MARKNRVSVPDGVYHITTRVANRAMLLRPEGVRDRIAGWIESVAAFSGVEVWSWCVMENHLHLLVHVPPVPRRYWLDPGSEPAAHAFGMRPPECRPPRWSPDGDSPLAQAAPAGDSPSPNAAPSSAPGDSPSPAGDCPPSWRPPVGFTLPDAEMLSRLRLLYGPGRAGEIERSWASLRLHGLGGAVDAAKERYCRRMYNVSQFAKTLKERVSTWYNAEYGHSGCLWQGRFHSGVVERTPEVLAVVAAYIGYNPVKAGLAPSPDAWRWGSYALAARDAGPRGGLCREMYARMLGRPWEEVREVLESIYADGLPDGVGPAELGKWLGNPAGDSLRDEDNPGGDSPRERAWEAVVRPVLRASQAIHATVRFLSHGAYVGRGTGFLAALAALLPARFPREGAGSLRRCEALSWELPRASRAA